MVERIVHMGFLVLSALILAKSGSGPDLQLKPSDNRNVLMNRYDLNRTGATLGEKILNTTNVNVKDFGKLFSLPVEGDIYAQPLIVFGVDMPGVGKRNIAFVATMHNIVYAFDADAPTPPDWTTQLGQPFTKNVVSTDIPGKEVGILSTPALDLD